MLEYTLTADDLVAFAFWQANESGEDDQQRRRFRVTGAWIVGAAAYLVAFAVSTLPLLLNTELALAGLTEVVDIAVGGAAGWWEWRRGRVGASLLMRRYLTKARVSLEKSGAARRLEPDADGLTIAAGGRSTHVAWAQINRVVDTADHVFILTGAKAAHVVPRRANAPGVAHLAEDIRVHLVGG